MRKVSPLRPCAKACENRKNVSGCADGMGSPISKETFLQRARARFATHYDYSEIVYKSYKTPILIRCQLHPVKLISITPEKHLQTSGGCKFCLRESRIRLLERELLREPAVRELPASGDPLSAPSPLASAVRPVRRGPAEGRHGLPPSFGFDRWIKREGPGSRQRGVSGPAAPEGSPGDGGHGTGGGPGTHRSTAPLS